jgi:hypothetical protein
MQTRGTALVIDTIAAKQPVITISGLSSGSARTLNELESGSVALFDAAAGGVFTLPSDPTPGTFYDFKVYKDITANSAKIITGLRGSTLALICGAVTTLNVNDGVAKSFSIAEGATANRFVAVTSNGTTTGGQLGTELRVTALSKGTWYVSGLMFGSGVMATPASTS